MRTPAILRYVVVALVSLLGATSAHSQTDYSKVFNDYTKVVSTVDGGSSMWDVYVNKKTNQVLAQLPRDFDKKKYFIAVTVASGERFAGLQAGDYYVYWKRVGDRLMLIQPNLEVRSTGDQESKSSVDRIFTDKLLLDLPVLATSPKGEPVIDLDELMVKNSGEFFGSSARVSPTGVRLQVLKKAKAFPENIEVAFEVPLDGGRLKTLHYSISVMPTSTGYKPRKADDRVGFFTTAYDDLGKFKEGEKRARYINRWHLEKADPTLKLSPPKQPIVFYIEHTAPIRYRRFVREGVLYWNKAFEKVGIFGAIEVYFQDKATGAHMDKDPEDVRYNFIRWLNNDISTAIGPSRVDPRTGQILDADIVLTDGWIRVFEDQFSGLLPQLAMQGFGPETLSWLDENPSWDPRLLLAAPHERNLMLKQRAMQGALPLSGHPFGQTDAKLIGDDEFDGLVGRTSQLNGMCMAATGKSLDMTMLRMLVALGEADAKDDKKEEKEDDKKEKKDEEEKLDGIPARFVGPLLADLVAHEVGHTLGLRHNFKASALYSMAEINSDEVKGKKPFTASVMDYNPLNINMKDGKVQGDFAMIDIGPYDEWAIEYGYSMNEADLPKILSRCSEKELQYLTDQDTIGPDPFARRYDFTSNPLDYAKNQMKLAKYHRERLLEKYVEKGDSWAKARKGYNMTLGLQTKSLSMMTNWIGGAFVRREHKGDTKEDRAPIEPVDANVQRDTMKWIMENAFRDESFGLSPEILKRLRKDFLDSDETFSDDDSMFPVHDRVMGIQSSVLTMVMNPTTLRRVYDNELIIESDKDAFTLPELLNLLEGEIWSELKLKPNGNYSARKPMISSLRRNLQRTYVERLIDLANVRNSSRAAIKPVSTLARLQLKRLKTHVEAAIKAGGDKLDAYTAAHLEDMQVRMEKGLETRYLVDPSSSRTTRLIIGSPAAQMRCTSPNCSHCQPQGWDNR